MLEKLEQVIRIEDIEQEEIIEAVMLKVDIHIVWYKMGQIISEDIEVDAIEEIEDLILIDTSHLIMVIDYLMEDITEVELELLVTEVMVIVLIIVQEDVIIIEDVIVSAIMVVEEVVHYIHITSIRQ